MEVLTNRHIALCGFMGCGKSTLGSALAGLLEKPFTDLDNYIEKFKDLSVTEIFREHGETYFRQLEKNALGFVLNAKPRVIALGGGTICDNENIERVKERSLLIYIDLPEEELFVRLKNDTNRPLIANSDEATLKNFIRSRLLERRPFYHQAHITVDGMELDAAQLVSIIEQVKENIL